MFSLRRYILLLLLLCFTGSSATAQKADTFRVYFDLNVPELNARAKDQLDSLLYVDALGAGKYILIVGYADYLGNDTANIILSEKRAANVQQYLLSMNIDSSHIRSCIGKGAVQRTQHTPDGYAPDRRVDIVAGKTQTVFNTLPGKHTRPGLVTTTKSDIATIIDSLKVGQTFVLNNLYFHTGRHTVKDESLPELDKLYNVLKENPSLKIKIEGHVCCVPNDKDALDEDVSLLRKKEDDPTPYFIQRLSLNRAMYIYYYLVKKGISSQRLQYDGYGRSRPLVAQEKSLADEDKNKRVEIRITDK